MEFHIPYLKILKDMGWETAVAAKNDYEEQTDCKIPYCDYYYDIPFNRSPAKLDNIKAYRQLKRIIEENDYDIIHCHTPVGGAIGRLAAIKARKNGKKVIYTAHGFHFYKGAPLLYWGLFYPIERILAHMTDALITINKEDYNTAKGFKARIIEYIPGIGIDIRKFSKGSAERAKTLKRELGIPEDAYVWLSVGEVNKNKNQALIIEALKDFENVWFVLCGRGILMDELREKARSEGVLNRTVLAGYRDDVEDFYKMADLFIFPSYREGLPVALMEAMASGIKCVAAINRGTDDLMPNSKLRFNPNSLEEMKEAIREAMMHEYTDEITENIVHLQEFDINRVLNKTKEVYLKVINRQ